MKTPTWATAIGILMICFGGCSILNDFQSIKLPEAIEKAKVEAGKEMKEAQKYAAEEKRKSDSLALAGDSTAIAKQGKKEKSFEEKQKELNEILNIPEFSKTWIVRFGYIGVIAALVYIAGGVFLLVRKSFSIKLVYAALGLSILTSGLQCAVLTSTSSSGIIALTTGLTQLIGIIIDVIFIGIIFSSDKDAYVFDKTPSSNP